VSPVLALRRSLDAYAVEDPVREKPHRRDARLVRSSVVGTMADEVEPLDDHVGIRRHLGLGASATIEAHGAQDRHPGDAQT
jgi:hypothetical protein